MLVRGMFIKAATSRCPSKRRTTCTRCCDTSNATPFAGTFADGGRLAMKQSLAADTRHGRAETNPASLASPSSAAVVGACERTSDGTRVGHDTAKCKRRTTLRRWRLGCGNSIEAWSRINVAQTWSPPKNACRIGINEPVPFSLPAYRLRVAKARCNSSQTIAMASAA